MQFHYFFFATSPAGEAFCFATKYIGQTNTRGTRFSWWQINPMMEPVGKKSVAPWFDTDETGQAAQLRAALGEGWTVYEFYQTLKLHSK